MPKTKKRNPIHIENLSDECGYFFGDYECSHKSENKDEDGKCFSWDCPLGNQAEDEDFNEDTEYISVEDYVVLYEPLKGQE